MSDRGCVTLPYCADSETLFECVADSTWPVFLDSGRPWSATGRYDIIAAEPRLRLITRGRRTEILSTGTVAVSHEDPLIVLRRCLGPRRREKPQLPFAGGALGYFAYDLGSRFEHLPMRAQDVDHTPEMAMGIYDWAVIVDHALGTARFVWNGDRPQEWIERFENPSASRVRTPFRVLGGARPALTKQEYARAFDRIKAYIAAGDCYQVNLAQDFNACVEGDSWLAYRALRRLNPAPFAAFLRYPFCEVLSCSPERFLKVRDGRVETKPIKGTRPRDPARDAALIAELRNSEKDRAENVMIVDLLRNDLGKVCEIGSVSVPRLFEVESYATVHHLVSTVHGRLRDEYDALDLLRACFPGGSITGAPKLRAMEIIEELEPHRRGVYCGSIGYVGYDRSMDLNVVIRTIVRHRDRIRFSAGGGLVADSRMEEEYLETLHKAAAMLRLIEQMGIEHVGY